MKKGLFCGLGGLRNVTAACEGWDLVSVVRWVALWNDRQLFWAICDMRAHCCLSPWQCEFALWSLSCNDLKAILGPLPSISICGHSHSSSSVCRLTQSCSH